MGKRIGKVSALAIVLLYQVSSVSFVSAGMFSLPVISEDDTNSTLVQAFEDRRTSSDNFYRWTRSVEEKSEEEPKIEYKVTHETIRQVTAYNVGDPYQTDSTPCIGAYPKINLCDAVAQGVRVCAANFVPLNTVLRIIDNDGQSFECVVWDRMNSRYTKRVDIAMNLSEKTKAKQFGLNKWKVQILEEEEPSI